MAKRRSNQEGSIYQRPNGRWTAQVSVAGKRLAKTFASQRECRTWLLEQRAISERGLKHLGFTTTVAEYFSEWLASNKPALRPKTFVQYEAMVKRHIVPVIGKLKMAELKPYTVQQLYTTKSQSGESQYTVRMVHRVLHRALKVAEMQGLIASNPAKLVIRPKVARKEMKVLSDTDVRQFMIVAQGTRNEALYQLAVTTGMRQGEILGLQWPDVDWASLTIGVRRQMQYIRGEGLVLNQPKTTTSVRTVQIGPVTLRKLMAHRKLMEFEQGLDFNPKGLVFISRRGKAMGEKGVRTDFQGLLRKAGLPKMRFHDLRHTAASLMLSSGMPVIKVARQLGHARPSTTLDIYGHLIPGLEAEAAAKLDELVTPIATQLQQAEGANGQSGANQVNLGVI